MTIDPEVHGGEGGSIDNLDKIRASVALAIPRSTRTDYPETVGLSGLEWQGSVLVEPYVAGGWRHSRSSGRDRWEISVPMNEVHQRCVWDWLCAARIGDRHEVFEQGIMFRVVPTNVHRQGSVGVLGREQTNQSPRTTMYSSLYLSAWVSFWRWITRGARRPSVYWPCEGNQKEKKEVRHRRRDRTEEWP